MKWKHRVPTQSKFIMSIFWLFCLGFRPWYTLRQFYCPCWHLQLDLHWHLALNRVVFFLVGEISWHHENRQPLLVDSWRTLGSFVPPHCSTQHVSCLVPPWQRVPESRVWSPLETFRASFSFPTAESTLDLLISPMPSALLWLWVPQAKLTDDTSMSLLFDRESYAWALFLWLTRKRNWNNSYRKWMHTHHEMCSISGAFQLLKVSESRQEDVAYSLIWVRSWSKTSWRKTCKADAPQPTSPASPSMIIVHVGVGVTSFFY